MQNIINAIDKATRAGVYSLDEVLAVSKSIENLGKIVNEHQQAQQAAKNNPVLQPDQAPLDKPSQSGELKGKE